MSPAEIVALAARLAGPAVSLVVDLVQAGMAAGDAEELVRRDIESLRAEYMRGRAGDDAALEEKHGRGSE